MRWIWGVILIGIGTAALADPPPMGDLGRALSGAEFEAFATGKTLTYAEGGTVWGQEQYLPGRRVIWAFDGEGCEFGTWSEALGPDGSPMVCFTYETEPGDQNCWQFFRTGSGLVARFMDGAPALSELGATTEPMACQGPQVGV